jgi:hypothetical protein
MVGREAGHAIPSTPQVAPTGSLGKNDQHASRAKRGGPTAHHAHTRGIRLYNVSPAYSAEDG